MPVAVVVVQRRRHEDVLDAVGAEVDLPRDARVPPLILILDEARVRPAHDDGDELVGATVSNEVGDVEFRRCPGVLREADRLAVHDEVEHALDTAEAEDDPPPAPAARDGERAAVDSGRVCLGYVRRRVAERHHDVRVVRLLVPLHRPQTGHVDPVPAATRPGRGARGGRPVDEPELPYTVERPPQGRRAGVGDRGGRCRVRDERGPGRQSVQALELRRLPARLPAGEQQPVDRGRHALTAAASRSDSAAASGATGLK